VGTGLGTPPEENPKPLEDMKEGSMKRREARGEGGKASVCMGTLLTDLVIFCPLDPIGPTNFKNSDIMVSFHQ
jgi:hypothetical protein